MIYSVILLLSLCLFPDISAHAATPLAPVPQTGQNICNKSMSTDVISCTGTGQDGDTLTGVVWPKPRFTDNGDQTMTDQLTGLTWTKAANPADSYRTWQQALNYIKALNKQNYLGHNDWRLPNINELESLVNKGSILESWLSAQGFIEIMADHYWSSTTYASYTNNAWSVNIYGGILASRSKSDGSYVWPVRSGRTGVLTLPATGQSICYDDLGIAIACAGTGQDGELRTGAVWPNPRFIDNADQTMTDQLTGLVWSKDGKAPGPAACRPGSHKNWGESLAYIKCLNSNNYLGKKDWRLPNRNELTSLVNHGHPNSSIWLSTQGFDNIEAYSYWSSTTYTYATWNAWRVGMHDGAVTSQAHKQSINVWPVRSGK